MRTLGHSRIEKRCGESMSFPRPVFIRVIRTRLYPLFPRTACYSPSSLQRFYFLPCNCPLLASADLRSPRSVSYSRDRREIYKPTLSRTTDHLANTTIKSPLRLTTQRELRKGLYLRGEKNFGFVQATKPLAQSMRSQTSKASHALTFSPTAARSEFRRCTGHIRAPR